MPTYPYSDRIRSAAYIYLSGWILPYGFRVEDNCNGYPAHFSLGRLSNRLKIDRIFVIPPAGEMIFRPGIFTNIGEELGMNIIAEGGETQVELDRLVDIGCCQIQGYYFAKAMRLNELENWLDDNQHQVIAMQSKQQA